MLSLVYSDKIITFVEIITTKTIKMKKINTETLFEQLDLIKIEKEVSTDGDIQIVTSYGNRVMKRVNVSKIYEIFDFGPFAKDVVKRLMEDFNIRNYDMSIRGGVQELILEGDDIEVENKMFSKRFYILSSSDKSRRLQINFGLYSKDDRFSLISSQGSVSRKHINGLNDIVDDMLTFDNNVFDEQLELLGKIIRETILYSQVRKVILEMDSDEGKTFDNVTKSNILKMRSFNQMLRYTNEFNFNEHPIIWGNPHRDVTRDFDFELDAYLVFSLYLKLFNNKDSYVMKKETEKISKITKRAFREERLSYLLSK